ncbi:hypothetical protein O181_022378 [Austropuccinia psidii MF-1]|uniref:Reverse transcriptase domain-containing protein n=1 Tax=Austropuccinia psidii MF-1 TaxID=1389203 RepID=A0A9Q3GWA2_9BASI|nr:hypothetical protein [Austropuccinia psidii MF-1]
MCVDYHKLNAVTRKNKYTVPPMTQLLAGVNASSIFCNIVMHGAYKLLRIKKGDEYLTAFRAKYGSHENFVTPFGLTNSPSSFPKFFNDIFSGLLDVYVVFSLAETMFFAKSEEEQSSPVSTVLARLRANNLFAKISKNIFHSSSVKYLGYVVSSEFLKMDQEKVKQVLNWPPPISLKDLQ